MTPDQIERSLVSSRAWKAAHPGHLTPADKRRRFESAEHAAMTEALREVRRLERADEAARRAQTTWLCVECGIESKYKQYDRCWLCERQRRLDEKGGPIHMVAVLGYSSSCAVSQASPYTSLQERRKVHRQKRQVVHLERRGNPVVKLPWDGPCGVCGQPIDQSLRHDRDGGLQNPWAKSVGHEPPRSRALPGETIYVRPEHWICNQRKGVLRDEEIAS